MRTNMLLTALGVLIVSAALSWIYLPAGPILLGSSVLAAGLLRDDGKPTK